MELATPRLRLCALEPAGLRALLGGVAAPGARWARGYPLDGSLVAAAMQLERLDAGADRGPFGLFHILVREAGDLVVGDIGFHGAPDELGIVSIGFGIVPAARHRGYAAEALRTVLDWALGRPEVRAVCADTDLVHLDSQRVLVSAGMRLAAAEGDRKLYEIQAS
ncbi:GNAT family N-acetyltransferase [Baekduia soli]|uniref:GNAT family N-acetyltransferase n=1 Tax=Baekduia soli TaxID=496014 RepID=A0A5B8U7C8_9ACTN|nr:GNAT family N-acetyltransferase [Baekduia soli]QEC48994.1 GNAT family N-acetyltransferase [Baekduia soli]